MQYIRKSASCESDDVNKGVRLRTPCNKYLQFSGFFDHFTSIFRLDKRNRLRRIRPDGGAALGYGFQIRTRTVEDSNLYEVANPACQKRLVSIPKFLFIS